MDINRRIPHEQAKVADDGLPTTSTSSRTPRPTFTLTTDDLTVNPGTGGDFAPRRPSTGGELIDENDVEAHVQLTTDDLTVNPGTGGDFAPRRPSTGGEFIDENDVEGHTQ